MERHPFPFKRWTDSALQGTEGIRNTELRHLPFHTPRCPTAFSFAVCPNLRRPPGIRHPVDEYNSIWREYWIDILTSTSWRGLKGGRGRTRGRMITQKLCNHYLILPNRVGVFPMPLHLKWNIFKLMVILGQVELLTSAVWTKMPNLH